MSEPRRDIIALPPGGGRRYALGDGLTTLFLADEAKTAAGYSISQWWMEPGQPEIGAHAHEENDEIFYVLAGTPEILIGADWRRFATGSFVRIPPGIDHDFRNPGTDRACLLNLFIPGGFERRMPAIVDWFANR